MQLLICNGSPRGMKSNSARMIEWLIKDDDDSIQLSLVKKHSEYMDIVKKHSKLVIIYPLYVDSMPGIVKAFIEMLEDNMDVISGSEILFIIHSGFPEAINLRILERYHNILKGKLDLTDVQTIITPGSEGVRFRSNKQNQKRMDNLRLLIDNYRNSESLSNDALTTLEGFETMPKLAQGIVKILGPTRIMDSYWNGELKKNNAYDKRYDQPYFKE